MSHFLMCQKRYIYNSMNLKICKLRSFLNREFTVLGIYTFVYTPKIFYTYLRYRSFYLTGIRNQIVDKLRKMFEKDSKDLEESEDSSISRFLRLNWGRTISGITKNPKSTSFIFQAISMAVQRGNVQCVQGAYVWGICFWRAWWFFYIAQPNNIS